MVRRLFLGGRGGICDGVRGGEVHLGVGSIAMLGV